MTLDERFAWYEPHQSYLRGDPGGAKAELFRADLFRADLGFAKLGRADLRGANLYGANLRGANLYGANLHEADLRGADLRGADLRRADLSGADLRWAGFHEADLRGAHLRGADLIGADLYGADLREADLRGANSFRLLTQTDHGYSVYATWRDGWRIVAGCRDFSVADAREHWGAADYHTPSSGSRIIACLDWLERQPEPEADSAQEAAR